MTTLIHASTREIRAIAERALIVAGMSSGCVRAAAQLIIDAEAHTGGGLSFLQGHLPHVRQVSPFVLRTPCTLDAGGQSALIAGWSALDLATLDVRRGADCAQLVLVNAVGVDVLADALPAAAARRGLMCELLQVPNGTEIICRPGGVQQSRRDRVWVDSELFYSLRTYGNQILAPSSERSLRDAGF